MSAVLLKNQLANGRLQVRIAWGANLAADPATWSWTDVTSDVVQAGRSGITISIGRANEQSVATPASCSFRLKNQTGAYTPASPTATNYPNVRLGTPVQVRVSLDGGSTWTIRFQGEAASWAPGWDAQGKFAYVALAAAGITRRLGQGSKPIQSTLHRALTGVGVTNPNAVPYAYWPLEDGSLAIQASSPTSGIPPLAVGLDVEGTFQPGGTVVDFAALSGAPGSDAQPDFQKGGLLLVAMPNTTLSPTYWRIQFLVNLAPLGASSGGMAPVEWIDRAQRAFDLTTNSLSDGGVKTSISNLSLGSLLYSAASNVNCDDGDWHEIRYELTQSGSNAALTVKLDGATILSTTLTSFTLSPIGQIVVDDAGPPGKLVGTDVVAVAGGVGHIALWYSSFSDVDLDTLAAMAGHAGETATARLARLCAEEKISFTLTGSSDTAMGPQGVDTIFNLLRACETADLGYLLDGLGPGLFYVARSWLYNQPVALTIDANSGQVPATPGPQPALDDQRLHNRFTATRTNGSSVTVEDTNGALGTAALGVFDNRVTLNVQTDRQLTDIAAWLVHLGTVEGMRYPQIPLDFTAVPELASTWLAVTPTERIDVTNLSNRLTQHPAGSVSLIAEGWTEFLNATAWRVVINCSAFRPWEVFTIQDTRLGRIETDGSTLNSSATSGATSLSVASSGGVWDTGFTPFDIDIEGEQITVTAVTGSSSPQTFTVTRSVNGVVKAHNSAAVVKLWKPGVLAL